MRRTATRSTSSSSFSLLPQRCASFSASLRTSPNYAATTTTILLTTQHQQSSASSLFKLQAREFSSSSILSGQKKERPILMVPGPIEFSEAVLNVLAEPTMSHVSPEFIEIFGSTLARVRQVFLASKDSQPFVVAGSGVSGWDMAASNILEKGDRVLVVSTGYFGDRFGDCLSAYGADVTYLRAAVGDCPTLEQFEKTLGEPNSFKMITLTHVDTSTGVLTDVKSFAQVARRHSPNAIVVVDGVCATGGEEHRMEEWDIDITLTASQKAMGAPPGLSILVAGPRALAALQNRKTPVLNYFNDWNRWIPIFKAYEARTPSYFATPPTNLIRSLSVSLDEILSVAPNNHVDAMNARFKAHQDAGAAVRRAVKALGLTTVAKEGIEANTITAIRFPQGVTGPDLLPKIRNYGVELASGLHPQIKTEYFRVGHMNISVVDLKRGHLEKTFDAIERALIDCGYNKFNRNAAVNEVKALRNN